jgi:hypothetical protein
MLIPNSRVYKTVDDKKFVEVKSITDVDWDKIETTFPTTTTELYTYKKNDIVIQTVLITYQSAAKNVILLMEKTRLD